MLTPTLMGEMIYDVVGNSIKALLDPSLTASWEKGLTMVAEGNISSKEYIHRIPPQEAFPFSDHPEVSQMRCRT